MANNHKPKPCKIKISIHLYKTQLFADKKNDFPLSNHVFF